MHKRIVKVLLALMLALALVIPTSSMNVEAASYPLVIVPNLSASVGETVSVVLDYWPSYKNENLKVVIYDSDGYSRASTEQDFYNSGTLKRYFTVTWDTEGYEPGKYTVEVTKYFYSLYRWNEAPSTSVGYVTLYDDSKDKISGDNVYTGSSNSIYDSRANVEQAATNSTKFALSAWDITDNGTYSIQLTEMHMGSVASEMAKEDNPYNYSCYDESQWIYMKWNINNKGNSEIKAEDIVYYNQYYKSTGIPMTVVSNATLGAGDRKDHGVFDIIIQSGQSDYVWVGICVPKSQGLPYLRIMNSKGEYTYLNTNPAYENACKKYGHTWDNGEIVKESTCKKHGEKQYTCTICGETKSESLALSNEHDWNNGRITTKATYSTKGIKTYTCRECGKTQTEKVDKLVLNPVTINQVKSGKAKQIKITWKKNNKASGYEIQYSKKPSMSKKTTIDISRKAIKSFVIDNLTANKIYYVRMRAYVIENDKKIYSSWSEIDSVKVKK